MNQRPFPNRDNADRRNRENEIEQDRREHVARCADSPTAGSLLSEALHTKREAFKSALTEATNASFDCGDYEFGAGEPVSEKYEPMLDKFWEVKSKVVKMYTELEREKASLAAEMHNLERENARFELELDASCNAEELRQVRAENERLEGLLAKLVEAGESLKKALAFECHKIGDVPREIDEWDAATKAKDAQP